MINIPKNEKLRIKYIRLDKLNQWKENPKLHDLQKIAKSITQNGFQAPGKLTESLDEKPVLLFGNGRAEAVIWLFRQKQLKPKGIAVDTVDEMWCLPVLVGNDIDNTDQAIAFALDDNLIGAFGGDNTHLDTVKVYDREQYLSLALATIDYSVTAEHDDLELMQHLINNIDLDEPSEKPSNPNTESFTYKLTFLNVDERIEFLTFLKEGVSEYETEGEFLLRILRNSL